MSLFLPLHIVSGLYLSCPSIVGVGVPFGDGICSLLFQDNFAEFISLVFLKPLGSNLTQPVNQVPLIHFILFDLKPDSSGVMTLADSIADGCVFLALLAGTAGAIKDMIDKGPSTLLNRIVTMLVAIVAIKVLPGAIQILADFSERMGEALYNQIISAGKTDESWLLFNGIFNAVEPLSLLGAIIVVVGILVLIALVLALKLAVIFLIGMAPLGAAAAAFGDNRAKLLVLDLARGVCLALVFGPAALAVGAVAQNQMSTHHAGAAGLILGPISTFMALAFPSMVIANLLREGMNAIRVVPEMGNVMVDAALGSAAAGAGIAAGGPIGVMGAMTIASQLISHGARGVDTASPHLSFGVAPRIFQSPTSGSPPGGPSEPSPGGPSEPSPGGPSEPSPGGPPEPPPGGPPEPPPAGLPGPPPAGLPGPLPSGDSNTGIPPGISPTGSASTPVPNRSGDKGWRVQYAASLAKPVPGVVGRRE
jgi:hypothetical protein